MENIIKNKIKLLILPVVTLICFVCFSQAKQDSTQQKLFVEFNNVTPQKIEEKTIWQEYIIPQIASIIALLALIGGWRQFRKQIKVTQKNFQIQLKATKEDILKKYDLERTSLLLENISNLMLEIKNDNGNFRSGQHISDNHFLYEHRVLLLLDQGNHSEKQLSDYLLSLTNGQSNSQTTQNATNTIQTLSNIIINNKIKE
jgi:hypothetical protein